MLRAGWSKADITPPAGVDLCGFGGRAGPSQGVHDPLFAKALCVTDRERRVALITADLIGLDAGTVAEVRRRVAARLGGEAPTLMVACSHTHSGPSTPCLPFLGLPDPAYMESLIGKLAGIVVEASNVVAEAEIAFGQAEVQVGINRRQRVEEGRIVLGRNEGGTTAPYVDVLRAQTGDGCAVLFSHTAHPVTLGGDNLLISADWPGYAQRFAEEALGERCLAMYGQGCCGNINSDPRGSFEVAEQQGRAVAEAVVKTVETLRPAADWPVGSVSEVVELPLQDPPPLGEAQATLASAVRERDANEATDNHGMKLTRQGLVDWAERLVALAEAGATHLTQPFEIQALRIASVAIVGLPGEVFVEYQHQIKACSPFAQTFVLAYTNGNIGYVPTEAAFPQGGYEVDSAIKYYGTTMLTPECERVIVSRACELLRRLTHV
jgi:neutral ceramidase